MSMSPQDAVTTAFRERYGESPTFVIRAPGRVNLIGEHTDYNDGFVFPMAINRAIWLALRPRADRDVVLYALDFNTELHFSLDNFAKEAQSPAEYVKGMAWALMSAGLDLRGWEGILKGDVPIGAGLSSSAAMEMATARAFAAVSGFDWHPADMAKLGQKAENQWVGVKTGIMDQMISASGQTDHALMIDCRTLETTPAPLPPGTVVVILDTNTRRELVTSAYDERRAQCEAAAAFFGVPALRDLTLDVFEVRAGELDVLPRKRARHVITENTRVLQARDAMLAGDAPALGQLMNQSHVSMRDDFEISGPELNAMVECAQAHPATYGARMTGGGFAGCAVALVQSSQQDEFVQAVAHCYEGATGITPSIYVSGATQGAEVVIR
ncbi:MAG: galactokinase [Anaerolineae bacterium]